jgi:predicted nucleic acid-binding protein
MTLYDSSVLIEYLDGDEQTVAYVTERTHERAVAPSLVLFEVYQGEVFKHGAADFDAVDEALSWLTIVNEIPGVARAAAELQNDFQEAGAPLAARDAFIAGAAAVLDERLAVADADFDTEELTARIDVDVL